jgi:hypothetical protein
VLATFECGLAGVEFAQTVLLGRVSLVDLRRPAVQMVRALLGAAFRAFELFASPGFFRLPVLAEPDHLILAGEFAFSTQIFGFVPGPSQNSASLVPGFGLFLFPTSLLTSLSEHPSGQGTHEQTSQDRREQCKRRSHISTPLFGCQAPDNKSFQEDDSRSRLRAPVSCADAE